MMTSSGFLALCVTVGFGLIMASLVLGFVRLAKGPTFSDRVVALDMMSVSIVGFCALYAIKTGVSSFVDIAIVVALIGFLATVALARFAERGLHRNRETEGQPVDMVARQSSGGADAGEGDQP
ncbi:pH regulation protein F [Meridianimarinicoccus roseus]|jgi:multisubunit Na+/H+ antiporter MnhF subunit|uniref:pH regulation protein F n=1 Tax=Meridianimarinicoccus roseus TaxID=2072018 RepID=A0A2V2LL93_9RHOB|nr:cation:proton antiporter [Meridianimarinicoccus roseus]PWR04354.1 pH regulation protein F [Meridianimarinicoccus roseus]